MSLNYPVLLTQQPEGGFVVTFPDIPEAITQGETQQEALEMAQEALETALSFYVDDRKPLPKPSQSDLPTVKPSALEYLKLMLYSEMLAQGIRKADLAKRLGWKPPQVDRLFDLSHSSRLEQLEAASKALGKNLEFSLS